MRTGVLAVLILLAHLGIKPNVGQAADYPSPIAVGGGHNPYLAAIKSDGTLWTWGWNDYGQLGNGTTNDSAVPVLVASSFASSPVRAVSLGAHHTFALTSASNVWSWGQGGDGQLGTGGTTNRTGPALIPGLANVSSIAAGGWHGLAVSNGFVWAWGYNEYGAAGIPAGGLAVVTPVRISPLANVSIVAAGLFHSAALSNGVVYTWGFNDGDGELGNGMASPGSNSIPTSVISNVITIAAGDYHTLALKQDGTVWSWGWNGNGQLGNGNANVTLVPVQVVGLSNVVSISAGNAHSLALTSDGHVWAWGENYYGELGNSTGADSWVPVRVPRLERVAAIATSYENSLALRADGTVWAWGDNYYGQIGDETTWSRFSPVPVETLTILSPGTPNPVARASRFDRGRGSDESCYSFTIPLLRIA